MTGAVVDVPFALLLVYVLLLNLGELTGTLFDSPRVLWVDALFLPLLAGAFWYLKRSAKRLVFEPALLILPLACLPSLINSHNPAKSVAMLAAFLYLIALFHVTMWLVDSKQRFEWLLKVWIVCSGLMIVLSLAAAAAYFTGSQWGKNQLYLYEPQAFVFPRMTGGLHSPTMFLSFLQITLVFVAIFWFGRNQLPFLAMLLLTILFSSLTTFSHGVAAFFLTLLMLAWGAPGNRWKPVRYSLLFAFAFFFIFNMASVIWRIYPVSILRNAKGQIAGVTWSTVPSIYAVQNITALRIAKDHPLIGIGVGTFIDRVGQYMDRDKHAATFASHDNPATGFVWRPHFKPHSTFLGSLAETGMLGLAGTLMLFGFVAKRLWSFVRSAPKGFPSWIAWCFFTGFAGFLLHAFTADILTFRQLWLMLGAAAAAEKIYS